MAFFSYHARRRDDICRRGISLKLGFYGWGEYRQAGSDGSRVCGSEVCRGIVLWNSGSSFMYETGRRKKPSGKYDEWGTERTACILLRFDICRHSQSCDLWGRLPCFYWYRAWFLEYESTGTTKGFWAISRSANSGVVSSVWCSCKDGGDFSDLWGASCMACGRCGRGVRGFYRFPSMWFFRYISCGFSQWK